MNDNNIDFRNEHSKFKDETVLREAILLMKLKSKFFSLLLVFSLVFLFACSEDQSKSISGASGTEEDPIHLSESGIMLEYEYPYDLITKNLDNKSIRSMLWLSESEILIESHEYKYTEDDYFYNMAWVLWDFKNNTFEELYQFETKSFQPISDFRLEGNILEVTSFGGEYRVLDLETKELISSGNEGLSSEESLSTFYDYDTDTLFYFEDGQIWKSSAGNITSLCKVTGNDLPHSLSLSPDKKSFAFSSVFHDAWVREIVIVNLETLEVTRIQKELTMPYLCWLDNQLCCIESTESGNARFYYGADLDMALELTFPDPQNFSIKLMSGYYNLGQQADEIPLVQEYLNVDGEWIAELYLLSAENGTIVRRPILTALDQNITSVLLSPDGTKILVGHYKAFQGDDNLLSVYQLSDR